MDSRILTILNKTKSDSQFHNHVSLGNIKGKYFFNPTVQEEFWDIYCDVITKPDIKLCIAETATEVNEAPILVDVDIKLKEEDGVDFGDKLYTEEQVISLVSIYQHIIRSIVEDCTDETLTCVLLEKPLYRIEKNENTYVKNGFHLHFPYCFLKRSEQEVHIIPRVKDKLNEMKTFENLGFENSGDVIDTCVLRNPWLLYGSRKEEHLDAYTITKIYNSDCEKITLQEAFSHYCIYDNDEELIQFVNDIEYYIPRILSITPANRETKQIKFGVTSPIKEKRQTELNRNTKQRKQTVKEALKEIKTFLPMLADHRADNRDEWLAIGFAIKNSTEEDDEGLELFHQFSQRCPEKYNEAEVEKTWESLRTNNYSLGTIRYFAQKDNPEMYKKYKDERSSSYMKDSLSGCHHDIAKLLYVEYSNEYVCASFSNKNMWYEYSSHVWKHVEDGGTLRMKISVDIVAKFSELCQKNVDLHSKCSDEGEKAMYQSRIKTTNKIINDLKSHQFKNNVMGEARELFYNPRFLQNLDTNPKLVAFQNGVYDLEKNIFRAGRPDDYISKQLPIRYIEHREDDESVLVLEDYFSKVFPDKSIRKYFLDVVSGVFEGNNKQKAYFWTGTGANGKSITQQMIESMLGCDSTGYAVKAPTTLFTGKKPLAGAPDPHMSRLGGGIRWCVFEEPDNNEEIYCGRLKYLTGGDSIEVRDLYQAGKDIKRIKPMFMLVGIFNNIPKLQGADFATWRRVRVIPFESTFVDVNDPKQPPLPETIEEQYMQKIFPRDDNLAEKIPHLLEPLAWYLLKHRKSVISIKEPPKVLEATTLYQRFNDIFSQYIQDRIIEEPMVQTALTDIYNDFKLWYRDTFPNSKVHEKEELKNYLLKHWNSSSVNSGQKWKGYRIRTIKDDQEHVENDEIDSDIELI